MTPIESKMAEIDKRADAATFDCHRCCGSGYEGEAMSDTPRTDAKWESIHETPEHERALKMAEFAEQLERELASATAESERLKAELEQIREERQQAGWERDLNEP